MCATLLGVLLVTSACGSAPSSGTSTPGATSRGGVDLAWDGLDEPTPAEADATVGTGLSSEFPATEIPASPVTGPVGDSTEVDVDPCRLVDEAEFASWLGEGAVTSILLEDGDACGWKGGDDSVRMAIGVVPYVASSPERFLPPDVNGPDQELQTAADVIQARWIEQYPVDQSSVLVVELAGYDLVIEMSTRGTLTQDELRLGAIKFAEAALGRIE